MTRYVLLMFACAGCNAKSQDVIAAEAAIARRLTDPTSAQFREVKIVDRNGWRTVCGSVKAKNKFGGYVGFKRFGFSLPDGDIWFEDDVQRDTVSRLPNGVDMGTLEIARRADQSAQMIQALWPKRCLEGTL